ncbi:DNA-J related domain-containing protein [Marinobacter sp. M216]|uniref:DNA-J related domain-containing protein n=1 Tax=Marinobacter albus TaxID=3030833 RepID=A0ABT7HB02_9GAMM|nr:MULTISPECIES: DNA-J related domain-containing protein [unclassified Marinobacter]MBW7470198.1 molecular chaperone DnaJ [Marinobacter sp. F4218]MDK9557538.1 DNA-J related domain-containing protein [Marinobacter sp. M216]
MTNSTSIRQPSDVAAGNNDGTLEPQIQHLLVAVEHELRRAPDGVSELSLIKALQHAPWELIGDVRFHDPEKLYPVHFLLFHALYRLRDLLAESGEILHISPLNIRLRPQDVVGGSGLPDEQDKLREFYLDLSQYSLPEDAIHRMMDDFWAGRPGARPEASETLAAAESLGFDGVPDSFPEVKQRFRRAVMLAHPDRGGDTRSIQALNQAFAVLKAHFQLAN